jgi:hypothetical protein
MSIDVGVRNALMDLHARYATTIDEGDAEGWSDCFTDDGVLETTRPLEVAGRADLVAFARAHAASATGPARHVTWHHTFTPVADGRVTGRCSAAILETTTTGVRAVFTARYLDTFVRVGAGWRLRRRSVFIDRVPD